jgi:hypothetical protein
MSATGGKKGRKVGRNKKKPCQQRYVLMKRNEDNKLRRAKRTANKFGHAVKIKIGNTIDVIHPKAK